jgi:hypothetical protein
MPKVERNEKDPRIKDNKEQTIERRIIFRDEEIRLGGSRLSQGFSAVLISSRWIIDVIFWPIVKEHAPSPAGAHSETGVEVQATQDSADKAAGGGCCDSSCSPLLHFEGRDDSLDGIMDLLDAVHAFIDANPTKTIKLTVSEKKSLLSPRHSQTASPSQTDHPPTHPDAE